MTAHEDFADSQFAPLMHLKDIERMQRNIDDMQVTHLTGQLPPGWDVPRGIGIDHGAPEGDSTAIGTMEHGVLNSIIVLDPPRHMPRSLSIYIRPSYTWFHSSGHVVGRAALRKLDRPRTHLAQAIDIMLAAPTLTHQA